MAAVSLLKQVLMTPARFGKLLVSNRLLRPKGVTLNGGPFL
jgi:hypothetical protein